jgi:5S rRNA maturation endonuclease (ribonuclease M5)
MLIADCAVDVENVLARLGLETSANSRGWAQQLCPFHSERRASFAVNVEHGGWVDYHDGTTGGLVKLVQQVRGCGREEALDFIGGVPQTETMSAAELLAKLLYRYEKPDTESDVRWWAEHYDSLPRDKMSAYFFERGFTPRTMAAFGVRFTPTWGALIWPMRDENENLVGFAARRLPGAPGPKYLYPKGVQIRLFPENMYDGDRAVIVEGPLDAMWLYQAGVAGALAILRNAMSARQQAEIRRRAKSVVLMLDNDQPGIEATEAAVKALSGQLAMIRVATYPREDAKDPQELSASEAQEAVAGAQPAVGWLLKRARQKGELGV